MSDNADQIRTFYHGYQDSEDSRLVRHQLERDITLRYLDNYLPGAGRILEIGAATGAYTLWLAQSGYEVTAVDISPSLLERCKARIAEADLEDRVSCHVADALDLSTVCGTNFDAVLLMGPLYHLTEEQNRLAAIQQAAERLRPGGLFASAHISRLGILGNLLLVMPHWITNQAEVRRLLTRGIEPTNNPGFHGYYASIEEIAPLHERAGLQTLLLAAVEPAISAADETYNTLTGQRRELWLNLLYQISANPNLLASSRHLLYLARKN